MGTGGSKIPSPGMPSEQPFPGIGLNDLYIVGKVAPSSTHFTRELVKNVSARGFSYAISPKTRIFYDTPPQSFNDSLD